jgi:hypothetical protein
MEATTKVGQKHILIRAGQEEIESTARTDDIDGAVNDSIRSELEEIKKIKWTMYWQLST